MRIHNPKRAIAAALAIAVAASVGFAVAAQGAVTDHDVRQSDFIPTLADVRSAGHFDFLKEGLRLYTDDSSTNAKVAQYFAPTSTVMPTSGEQDWYGTTPAPGMQIVFDTDGDRTNAGSFNILVGESIYGDDWWQSGGTARAAANGYTCPENGGGFGGDCHGTLAQWKASLDTDKPGNQVYAYGFSLGSGVKGDGVLRSQTYGDDRYVFTDEAAPTTPPTVNPAGTIIKSTSGRTVLFQMKTAPIPAGSKAGTLPNFTVTSTDSTVTNQTPAPGTTAYYTNTCPKKTTCTYKAYKNNSLVYTVTIKK
jgi:hypothetical protein